MPLQYTLMNKDVIHKNTQTRPPAYLHALMHSLTQLELPHHSHTQDSLTQMSRFYLVILELCLIEFIRDFLENNLIDIIRCFAPQNLDVTRPIRPIIPRTLFREEFLGIRFLYAASNPAIPLGNHAKMVSGKRNIYVYTSNIHIHIHIHIHRRIHIIQI